MNFLKRKWKKSKKQYFIFAMFLICCSVALMTYSILHPRIYNIAMFIVLVGFVIRVWKQMNPQIYTYPFNRKQDDTGVNTKKRADSIISYIVVIPFCLCVVMCISFPVSLMFPQRMIWEYTMDIKKMQESDLQMYQAFPNTVPKEAENVQWIVCPGFLQGASFEVLTFKTNWTYLEQIVAQYGDNAKQAVYAEESGTWSVDFTDYGLLTEPENTKVYVCYDNEDWNHHHISGFWVNEELGEIGFFAE